MQGLTRNIATRLLTAALIAAGVTLAFVTARAHPAAAAAADETAAERRLEALVETGIRAGGSWFTGAERATIERACGYAPGEWDGFDVNMTRRGLTCTNGRQVDTPEVRAVLAAAEPRIERRVNAVMASPEVTAAIAEITREAEAEAMREIAGRRGGGGSLRH